MGSTYWETRYAEGGTSGAGSEGWFAERKAELVNQALRDYGITTVLDIGCGDGQVAQLIEAPDYLGYDPSPTALKLSRARNPLKTFTDSLLTYEAREAHLSLDVLQHLPSDEDYRGHMALLWKATKLVLIWVTDYSRRPTAEWSRHRKWQQDVPPEWELAYRVSIDGVPVTFHAYFR